MLSAQRLYVKTQLILKEAGPTVLSRKAIP